MDNPSTSKAPRKPSTRTKKISVQDTEPGNVPRVELEKPNRRRKIPSVKSSEPGTVPRVELDDNPADMQRQIDDMKRQIQAQSESISQLSEVPSVLQSILSKLSDQPYEDDSEADNHPSDLDDIFGNNYDATESLGGRMNHDNLFLPKNANNSLAGHDNFEELWLKKSDANVADAEAGLLDSILNKDDNKSDGPPIFDQVEKKCSKLLSEDMSKDSLDQIKSRIQTPSNCSGFSVPKVNSELWSQMNPTVKTSDVKSQNFQVLLSKSLTCFAVVASEIAKRSSDFPKEFCEKTLRYCMDGVALQAVAMKETNFKRRQAIKPHLSSQFMGICNAQNPGGSTYLFGENLQERLRESKSMSSVMRQALPQRNHPYIRARGGLNFRGQPRFQAGKFNNFQRGKAKFPRQFRLQRQTTFQPNQ